MVSIPTLVEIFTTWLLFLQKLWDLFNSTINSILEPLALSFPPATLVWGFFNFLQMGNLTLLEFMLGAGLFLYLGYQLLIWVFNLIT